MYPTFRSFFGIAILSLITLNCSAGNASVSPVFSKIFNDNYLSVLDSLSNHPVSLSGTEISVSKEEDLSSSRICSCQVLNLGSNNYDLRSVVLLSEKTNDGSSDAFIAAKNRLQSEKSHLKKMFFDKITVLASFQGTGSCRNMFKRLQSADRNLKLYEIVNAD